jgi:spore germination protein GerM
MVLAGAVASVWLVFAVLPRWLNTTAISGTLAPASTAAADTRRIRATLFYVSESGDTLDPVDREVPYAATPVEQARRILDTEFGPAPQGLVSPIPAGAAVRSVFLTPRGDAYVDVNADIVTAHTGGSLDEALTVFAIVNALTVNMPGITGVQILVNGTQVDSLVGHLDLRRPLARSMQWVKKDNK